MHPPSSNFSDPGCPGPGRGCCCGALACHNSGAWRSVPAASRGARSTAGGHKNKPSSLAGRCPAAVVHRPESYAVPPPPRDPRRRARPARHSGTLATARAQGGCAPGALAAARARRGCAPSTVAGRAAIWGSGACRAAGGHTRDYL
jgi:hypothetical protein